MSQTVFILDSDPAQSRMTEYAIRQKLRYRVITASTAREGLEWIRSNRHPQPDVMLIDMFAGNAHGMHLMQEIKLLRPHLPIIALSLYGNDAEVMQAMQWGAHDVLCKPVEMSRLQLCLRNALKMQQLNHYITRIERQASGHITFGDLIGGSNMFKSAVAQAESLCRARTPVWIEGEYGTGKTLLARAIHGSGDRAGGPFVILECGALAGEASETVLTGADDTPGTPGFALGKLREAEKGTLLLKDVGALPAALQRCMAQYLESGKCRPAGAAAPLALDVRIISTASENIEALASQGHFDPFLARRLKAHMLAMPPLRDRQQDIEPLARHFVTHHAASENKHMYGLSEQALQHLFSSTWPGNVRQLSNLLWRAVLMCNQEMLDAGNIRLIQQLQPSHYENQADILASGAPMLLDMQGRIKKLKRIEEEAIRFALHYSGGCMTQAARGLGIGRSTLYRRINELELSDRSARA